MWGHYSLLSFSTGKVSLERTRGLRYPVREWPGPSAPPAPKAGALGWRREPPLAPVGVLEPVPLLVVEEPELLEGAGASTLDGVELVTEVAEVEPAPAVPGPPEVALPAWDGWRT
jgi:hypothetical protein